jgi:hypothetical protein
VSDPTAVASEPERSEAYKRFSENRQAIKDMIQANRASMRVFRDWARALMAPTDGNDASLEFSNRSREELIALLEQRRDALDRLAQKVRDESAEIQSQVGTMSRWVGVILVTITEAYLHDVLTEVARQEPSIMNDTKQAAVYAEVVEFTSIEELAEEMRSRWARNFVDKGGPRRWIEVLERRSGHSYPGDLVATLELVWGIRHVVVHNAGRATREFLRRHQFAGAVVGQMLPVTPAHFAPWFTAVDDFVNQTDQHFVAYVRGVLRKREGPSSELTADSRARGTPS